MTIRELLEARAKAVADARAVQDVADKAGRAPSAEERQKYDAFMAEADRLEGEAKTAAEDAERRSRLDRHERELRESRGRQTETRLGDGGEGAAVPTAREADLALRAWALGRKSTPEQRAAAERIGFDYNAQEIAVAERVTFEGGKEVRMYLPCSVDAHGNIREFRYVTPGEHRALSSGTTTAGGDSIPTAMMQRYSEVQKWYARLDALADVIRTENGQSLPWPTVTDTANSGRVLGEATTATTTTDPAFSKVTLGAFKVSSDAVAVPWELLMDSFLDLSGYLGKILGTRIGRKKNSLQTAGAGTTEPKGLITGAAVGVTAAVTNAFTMDETITLEHTVDPAYRGLPGTGFMFHDTIAAYVRKMKDGNGRYLWEPSLQAGQPDRFRGYPVFINNDMDSALTTGKKLMGFGNVNQAFVVRYAGAQRFIRDESIYVKEHMTYFEALERFDSNVVDSTAFKVLALL